MISTAILTRNDNSGAVESIFKIAHRLGRSKIK